MYLWLVTQHITIPFFFTLMPAFPCKLLWTNSIMSYSCIQPHLCCWTQFTSAVSHKELDSRCSALSVSNNCDLLHLLDVDFHETKDFSLFKTPVAGKFD